MDPMKVGDLKAFVEACKKDPALLADPSLSFFRDYLHSLGADLPQAAKPGPKVCVSIRPPLFRSFESGGVIFVRFEPQVTSMDDIDEEDDGGEEEDEDDLDMRDPTPEPDELDEDIVESDLELEGDVVEPDHDDTSHKVYIRYQDGLLCSMRHCPPIYSLARRRI
jgi:suppressor of tumorigenicity protein 13